MWKRSRKRSKRRYRKRWRGFLQPKSAQKDRALPLLAGALRQRRQVPFCSWSTGAAAKTMDVRCRSLARSWLVGAGRSALHGLLQLQQRPRVGEPRSKGGRPRRISKPRRIENGAAAIPKDGDLPLLAISLRLGEQVPFRTRTRRVASKTGPSQDLALR